MFDGVKRAVKSRLREMLEEEPEQEDTYKQMGDDFENYVANLFNPKYFNIENWTGDTSKRAGVYVKSDSNPDFTLSYKGRGKHNGSRFAVECKFRSKPFKNKVGIATDAQLRRYLLYSKKNDIPVFIVVGLGGKPQAPERMFCIPLEEVEYPELYMSRLERWERNAEQSFYWDGRTLR